jgi:hypothetical protein
MAGSQGAAQVTDKPRSEWTADDFRERTEDARRQARFKAAEERVRRIADGMPPLTPEQRERLALLLHPGPAAGNSDG